MASRRPWCTGSDDCTCEWCLDTRIDDYSPILSSEEKTEEDKQLGLPFYEWIT